MVSKYRNKKIALYGRVFASQKEAKRYLELKVLERVGEIRDIECQKRYVVIPAAYIDGRCVERECVYIADFAYTVCATGETVVEDVKGYRDTASAAYAKFVIKRKLMLRVYGIRVKEV